MALARRGAIFTVLLTLAAAVTLIGQAGSSIGREISVPRHLEDGEEFRISLRALLNHGERLFTAVWTAQEGAGGR